MYLCYGLRLRTLSRCTADAIDLLSPIPETDGYVGLDIPFFSKVVNKRGWTSIIVNRACAKTVKRSIFREEEFERVHNARLAHSVRGKNGE